MPSSTRRHVIILLAVLSCARVANSQQKDPPLKDTELLALVAGNSLSENVLHEIAVRGLAFRATDVYRAQLTSAGSDTRILSALSKATVTAQPEAPANKQSPELLQHLAAAGKLIQARQYEEAARELDAALQSGGGPEAAFVMGELLRKQEQWGMSAAVYAQLLEQNPDFPEVHTKASFLLYRMGDSEESLRQAKAALARTPDNPEAHKNAALAFELARKFDAAVVEYQEALRLKPDYEVVHYDLGVLYYNKRDLNAAIVEYKKALILDPNDAAAHGNLGLTYAENGAPSLGVLELREAKRLEPNNLMTRQNLGSVLTKAGLLPESVAEFRELEALAPDSVMCHLCFAGALHNMSDFKAAAQEYRKAAEMDPSNPEPHLGLGRIHEDLKELDAALAEYRLAIQLDDSSDESHRNSGRVLLAKKEFTNAARELQIAESQKPTDALTHDLYARALLGLGHPDSAINEFKQALALQPANLSVQVRLASAYEKKGDWATAIVQYHKAAGADSSVDPRGRIIRTDDPNPQAEYKAAQMRFDAHIADLKAAGKSAEAAAIEARVNSIRTASPLSDKLDALMQAGFEANSKRQFDEARRNYAEAVDVAEKIQPHDQRLAAALDYLGSEYLGQDFAKADAAFSRELKAVEELYGPQSPNISQPLQSLGTSALLQKDYAAAKKFYSRAVEVNEKGYGETSAPVAESLRILARVYLVQKQFDQAEPYLVRAVKIFDSPVVRDDTKLLFPLTSLCYVYENWPKPDKAEACEAKAAGAVERIYGPDSRFLVPVLTSRAKSLRTLGRIDEATQLDKRIQTIQATASN